MNAQTKIDAAPPAVYQKIAAVQGDLAKVGIAKDKRNSQQGYNFRGIDDVYAALSPLLAQHGLIIVPRVIERNCVEGQTRKGDPLFRVTVRAEFDFIAAEDGSIHTAATFGEAMDSADKATNKAMSAAYKYAAFMTFAIPTEGDNDADANTPEVASRPERGSGRDNSEDRQRVHQSQPDSRITDQQLVKLQSLLKATSTDPLSFCRTMGAPEGVQLFQMRQSMFPDALEHLETKLANMAKGETDTRGLHGEFANVTEDIVPF